MNVLLTISTGASFNNFSVSYSINGTSHTLYSPSVPKATLAAGYLLMGIPNNTLNVTIMALDGACSGYMKTIPVNYLVTTTTTTTTAVPPSLTQISNTEAGSGSNRTRIQVFEVGPSVPVGSIYTLTVYSHTVAVVAVAGDTPYTIAQKMVNAINATTAIEWNDHSSAPPNGTAGFKPTASLNTVTQIRVVLNWSNSFGAGASL